MILGIGTDLVDPSRFVPWAHFTHQRLLRVFSAQEIADATVGGHLRPEKLAVRFAAKEAFYKALSASLVLLGKQARPVSLLAVCQHVHVVSGTFGVPILVVNWGYLNTLFVCTLPSMAVHCSLSHERAMAVAFVVISEAI
jgi:phosphopantetheine--protein transferase-like protein